MTTRNVDAGSTARLVLPPAVSIATAATLLVNYLANALPINGQRTGDVTERIDVYFVPAGYVFSIWSLIYLGVLAYSVYLGFMLMQRRSDSGAARAIAPWYLVSAAANCGWLFAWHYNQFPLSMALMAVLLVSLIVIYRIQVAHPPATTVELWSVHIPFRVYLGWISVATIANATVTLDDAGWDGFGISEPTWGVVMVLVAAALGLAMSILYADIAYVLVLIWALVGIAVELHDTTSILVAALAGATVLAVSLAITVPRHRGSRPLPTR
ncbi:tryptophan-rich sensory protein [Mycolicibacterium thermoresistibile]